MMQTNYAVGPARKSLKAAVLDCMFGNDIEYLAAAVALAHTIRNNVGMTADGKILLSMSLEDWTATLCLSEVTPENPERGRPRVYPVHPSDSLRGRAWAAQGIVVGHKKGNFAIGRRYDGVVLARNNLTSIHPSNLPPGAPLLSTTTIDGTPVPTINGQTVDPERVYVLAGPIAMPTTYSFVSEGFYDERP